MSFDWKEFNKVARHLINHNGTEFISEAGGRCSVSRAYYAAHCYTRNFAKEHLDYVPVTKSPHEHLIRFFIDKIPENQVYSKVADNLEKLRKRRVNCDYYDDLEQKYIEELDKNPTLCIGLSNQIIENFLKLLKKKKKNRTS